MSIFHNDRSRQMYNIFKVTDGQAHLVEITDDVKQAGEITGKLSQTAGETYMISDDYLQMFYDELKVRGIQYAANA